jgi:putative transposase
MDLNDHAQAARQLALLRFAIVRDLLVDPPARGDLAGRLRALADQTWKLPDGAPVRFAYSTIEAWYYAARHAADPVTVLTSKARADRGCLRALDETLLAELRKQYTQHPAWTAKLHHKNLAALIRSKYPDTRIPSYATVRRVMKAQGWPRHRRARTPGQEKAAQRRANLEVRRFERTHAHALWHFDFHEGSRRVLLSDGSYHKTFVLAFLDDHTRVICHIQWYLAEDVERLVHGFVQAALKRGLPREVMHDNGSAMRAAEFLQGLERLGVGSSPTLAYSPYQNGKQEKFWDTLEGQLVAMLDGVDPLDLQTLNKATQAWVEGDYHRSVHDGIDAPPLDRLATAPTVAREAPSGDDLRFAFTAAVTRKQRRSDGTISLDGVRFEIPSRLRTLTRLTVRYRRWELSEAWVVDPRTDDVLARVVPEDPHRNADGQRRPVEDPSPLLAADAAPDPFPPHLRELMQAYAADGMPPAFLPLDDSEDS